MAVNLFNIPFTNTLNWPVELRTAAGIVFGQIPPGNAQVLTVTFDRIRIMTPTLPRPTYHQAPAVGVTAYPGHFAYLRPGIIPAQPYVLTIASPNHADRVIAFT